MRSKFSEDAVKVEYSALNFRDPMIATRRINITTLPYDKTTSNLSKCCKTECWTW